MEGIGTIQNSRPPTTPAMKASPSAYPLDQLVADHLSGASVAPNHAPQPA
jgi:hypothetical protein